MHLFGKSFFRGIFYNTLSTSPLRVCTSYSHSSGNDRSKNITRTGLRRAFFPSALSVHKRVSCPAALRKPPRMAKNGGGDLFFIDKSTPHRVFVDPQFSCSWDRAPQRKAQCSLCCMVFALPDPHAIVAVSPENTS